MKGNQIWTLKIESEALTEEVDAIANGFSNILVEFESLSNSVTSNSNDIERNASSIESLSNALEGISNEVYADIDALQEDLFSLSNSVIESASKITALQETDEAFTKNDVVLSSNLTVVGNLVTSDSATFESNVSIEGILSVEDDVTLSSNLLVYGTTTVHGSTSLQSNLDVSGPLNITGQAKLESNLEVLGSADITGSLTVNALLNAEGGMLAGTILPLSNEAFDLGSSNLRWRDLFLSGNTLDISGTRLQVDPSTKDLRISDTTNQLKSVIAREVQIGDTKTDEVTGKTIKSVLRRDERGRVQIQTLAASNNDLDSFTLQSDVTTDLNVEGSVDVKDALTVGGDLVVDSNMNVKGTSIVQGTANFNDQVNISGQLVLGGDVTAQSNLSVQGLTTIEGSTTLNSNVFVAGKMTLHDDLSVNKEFDVTGATHLMSNLNVHGVTTLNDTLVDGDLTVSGTTTFINSETLTIKDPVVQLGDDTTKTDSMDRGIMFLLGTGDEIRRNFFGWDRSEDNFVLLKDVQDSSNNIFDGGEVGNIRAGSFLGSNAVLSHDLNVKGMNIVDEINSNLERVESLSNSVESVSNKIYSDIDALQGDLVSLSNEVYNDIDALQGDLAGLSNEVYNDIEALQGDLVSLSNEVYNDIDALQGDLASLSNSVIDSASKITALQEANEAFTKNDVVLSSNLNVVGNFVTSSSATFESNLSIVGPLVVHDDVVLDSNLSIYGTSTVKNSALFESNIEVWGDISLSGESLVTNLNNLESNITTLDSAVSKVGMETLLLHNKLIVALEDGLENIPSQVTYDHLAGTSNVFIGGVTVIDRDFTVHGSTSLQGTADFNDQVNISGQLVLGDDVTAQSNLSVQGLTTIEGSTMLNSNVFVAGKMTLHDDLSVNKELEVTGATHFMSNLSVDGVTTLNDIVVDGDLRVSGTTTFINSETLTIKDPVIQLGEDTVQSDSMDRGITFLLGTGSEVQRNFFGWDRSEDHFVLLKNVQDNSNNIFEGGEVGNIRAGSFFGSNAVLSHSLNVNGNMDVTGNAVFDSNLSVIGSVDLSEGLTIGSNLEVNGAATFDSNVGIGIGLSNVQNKLHVGGSIRATGNIIAEETVVSESDVRLKNNITPIQNPYDIVKGMNGVMYSLKRDQVEPAKRYCGLIAQEVEKVLPEVVEIQSNGMLSVAYGNIVGVLVEVVKKMIDELEEMKKK